MRKNIEIGTNLMEFQASAATPFLYKHLFKEDLFRAERKLTEKKDELQKIKKAIEEAKASGNAVQLTDEQTAMTLEYNEEAGELIRRLAYIMHMEATHNEQDIWKELELPKYIAFLMNINGGDITANFAALYEVYQSGAISASRPKNA